MENLIVIVAFNTSYKIYVPYYIICVAYTNPECDILVISDDSHVENYDEALNIAKTYFKNKITIVNEPSYNQQLIKGYPNYCRALLDPKYYEQYKYVYIGDVDLLITENNFFGEHINHVHKLNITFSNWVRYPLHLKQISGLHFIYVPEYLKRYRSKIEYYLNNKDILIKNNFKHDEDVLYFILDDDEKKICNNVFINKFHGIHLGALRCSKPENYYNSIMKSCGDGHLNKYLEWMLIIIQKEEFLKIHKLLKDTRVDFLYTLL